MNEKQTKIKVGVVSLGCDKNRVDTEHMLSYLKENGFEIVLDKEEADVIVVNTCAFIESARVESINTILEMALLKQNNLKKLIVTGCLSQKFIDEIFDDMIEVDAFLGFNQYPFIAEIINRTLNGERINAVKDYKTLAYDNDRVISTPYHYAYLKIADGCNNHCTYCLIPKIRGKYVSTKQEEVLKMAENLVSEGVKELILVAQDVTKYGVDLYGEVKIVELLKNLSKIEGVEWIRLLYCYPDSMTDELIEEIKNNPKIVKYVDIPLQHIDDNVLKRMGRKIDYKNTITLLDKLRENDILVRSTFIVGFPGETRKQFNNLIDFIKENRLFNAGFFPYSKEEGTASFNLKGHKSNLIKNIRLKKAYKTQKEASKQNLSKYLGKTIKVIYEGLDFEMQMAYGRAEFNSPDIDGKVYFTSDEMLNIGEFYDVKIIDYKNYDLIGEIK